MNRPKRSLHGVGRSPVIEVAARIDGSQKCKINYVKEESKRRTLRKAVKDRDR